MVSVGATLLTVTVALLVTGVSIIPSLTESVAVKLPSSAQVRLGVSAASSLKLHSAELTVQEVEKRGRRGHSFKCDVG